MPIAGRTKRIVFVITLGALLIGVAIALNVSWIVIKWREVGTLILGVILFGFLITGVVLNTTFLVREIRRNEQQDSFLNAVTHELKTPIASIRLYLETLERRKLEDEQRHNMYRIMLDDTDRLLGTVEQVLAAGEARHGAGRAHREEVDVAALTRDAVELARLRHHVTPEMLRLGADPAGAITVMGNPEELRTAISNLLDNAVKYTGPAKDIRVNVLTPDLDTVMLCVEDNGIGIPRSELKRIFKRFYRVLTRGPGQVKGTGLGLFIVRSIARRHGGDAYAESEGEGCGSRFTIRLPRVYRV
jgi:signal transduction histidine kinase